mmetsp:Transcript_107045/g.148095  ORF Transcript_107045/g.148095 Transcript_107045/m.148095 type:complete len:275 (+) Transcript_107045:335-1159(+)
MLQSLFWPRQLAHEDPTPLPRRQSEMQDEREWEEKQLMPQVLRVPWSAQQPPEAPSSVTSVSLAAAMPAMTAWEPMASPISTAAASTVSAVSAAWTWVSAAASAVTFEASARPLPRSCPATAAVAIHGESRQNLWPPPPTDSVHLRPPQQLSVWQPAQPQDSPLFTHCGWGLTHCLLWVPMRCLSHRMPPQHGVSCRPGPPQVWPSAAHCGCGLTHCFCPLEPRRFSHLRPPQQLWKGPVQLWPSAHWGRSQRGGKLLHCRPPQHFWKGQSCPG